MDLNNRRTGKDATKPRALGLLGHSGKTLFIPEDFIFAYIRKSIEF